MGMRRARVRTFHKMSTAQIEENREELAEAINQFPPIRNFNVVVDNDLNRFSTKNQVFTEVYKAQKSKMGMKGTKRLSRDKEQYFNLFSIKEVVPPREPMEFGKVDYTVAIFNQLSGFVTDFFVYEDMNNNKTSKKHAKKKFAFSKNFHDGEGPLFLVIMVIVTDTTNAKKCKGLGVVKLEDLQKNDVNIYTNKSKDSTLSVIEQIHKAIGSNDPETSFFK